jgi:hypothetical protein
MKIKMLIDYLDSGQVSDTKYYGDISLTFL